jgi:hypothetical protein
MLADASGGVDWYFNGLLGLVGGIAALHNKAD